MKDKRLESKIKNIKEFMELWIKFHDLYKKALSDHIVSPEEEKNFLETKSLIARKYQMLKESLALEPSADDRTFDVITQVLSLESISTLSDLSIKKIESDWHNSYIQLNKMLGELENKTEELKSVSSLVVFLRKILVNPITNLLFLIIFIILVYLLIIYYVKENNPNLLKTNEGDKIKFESSEKSGEVLNSEEKVAPVLPETPKINFGTE